MQFHTISELKLHLEQISKVQWILATDPKNGVLSTSAAFVIAKEQKIPPAVAAAHILASLNTVEGLKFTQAGPYINCQLGDEVFAYILINTFVLSPANRDDKILFEYVSPNVAKPLHAGHLRNINIGESVFRLLKTQYKTVISDNHWGDWGVQFGILLWAIQEVQKRGNPSLEIELNGQHITFEFGETNATIDSYVKLYVWANQQKATMSNWDQLVRAEFSHLEKGDAVSRARWQHIVTVSQTEIGRQLTTLGVTPHDLNQGESFYESEMKQLAHFLEAQGIWQADINGRFFDFYNFKCENFDVISQKRLLSLAPSGENTSDHQLGRGYLISTQGYTTYLFRDVAARIQWARDLHADAMITVVDHTQNHHLTQVFVVCAYLAQQPAFIAEYGADVSSRLSGGHLKNIGYGFITLPSGKMSTRKGNFLTAQEIIDPILAKASEKLGETVNKNIARKVAIAAIKWADLSKDWISDAVFDAEKMLQFEGNTGVYQLYTIARLHSILRKNPIENQGIDATSLNETEKEILTQIYGFELMVSQATDAMKPHQICNYLYSLASKLNSWYAKYQVSTEPNLIRKQTLLALCKKCTTHLTFALSLLAIEAVEEL